MISIANETNIGSIAKLELVLITDVESYNPVVLKTGKAWEEIEMLPESGRFNFSAEDTSNGPLYNYRANFRHPKMDELKTAVLDKYLGIRSIARITDMNGKTYIIGSPGNLCLFVYDGDTGASVTDQNGYSANLSVSQAFKHLTA